MGEIDGRPYWELTYDEKGRLQSPDRTQFLDEVTASGARHLFVFSHGWGNSKDVARQLYQSMFRLIGEAADSAPDLQDIAFVGILWPSLWFPDPPASRDLSGGLATDSPSGARIAQSLRKSYRDKDVKAGIARLGHLIDEGEAAADRESPKAQEKRLAEFHELLSTLVTTRDEAPEDAGEGGVVQSSDPSHDYAYIAALMDSAEAEPAIVPGERGLGQALGNVWKGAKDAVRVASYYEMKGRAGDIGRAGLGPLLEALHGQAPGVQVHLVGHSFGARLVSYALAGISRPDASPIASLALIQGAFSHWSFAPKATMPFGVAGGLNGYADRVHGALVATHTPFDWAVGRWYPRASFLSRENNKDLGDTASLLNQWGGVGTDGYRGVNGAATTIQSTGEHYKLPPGFHNIDASSVIRDVAQSAFAGAHSDIQHPEVAWLIVDAATT